MKKKSRFSNTPTKLLALAIIFASTLATSNSAKAYDEDTHFYATYAMARYAGFKHAVAAQIALNAQWVDESHITNPTSVKANLNAVQAAKVRRLFHFSGPEKATAFESGTEVANDRDDGVGGSQGESLGDFSASIHVAEWRTFVETVPNSQMASELTTEGLIEGNFIKATAGLHTIEDSFAHAGTEASWGHASLGHWPDRPFADKDAIAKYWTMTETVFKAMVAIRDMVPQSALDKTLVDGVRSSTPNYKESAEELAKNYRAIPDVRKTIENNMLRDPRYVKFGMEYIFERSQKVGYLMPGVGYMKWVNSVNIDGSIDAIQGMTQAIANILVYQKAHPSEPILNKDGIFKDLFVTAGHPISDADYMATYGTEQAFIQAVLTNMLASTVPSPITITHRQEVEAGSPTRAREMDLRNHDIRTMIADLFGVNIKLVEIGQMTPKDFLDVPIFPARETRDELFITKGPEEQAEFDKVVHDFMFPDDTYAHWYTPGHITRHWKDMFNSHQLPKMANKVYQIADLRQKYEEQGLYKGILSDQDVKKITEIAEQQIGTVYDQTGLLYGVKTTIEVKP